MTTRIHTNATNFTRPFVCRGVAALLLSAVLAPQALAAGAGDSYQRMALLNPSQSQLNAEARGRVMIYDGLDNDVVERALDTQFGRIDHMMFTRIPQEQDDGTVIVEDDGC
jgi:hypothetical protein